MIRKPLAVWTTKIAESGRMSKEVLSPYVARDLVERIRVARIVVGYENIMLRHDALWWECIVETTFDCQTVMDVAVMTANK